MAQKLPVPTSGTPVPPSGYWWINILDWILEALKEVAPLVIGMNGVDAKLGVLVGNDAKVQISPEFIPDWLEEIVNRTVTVNYRPLNEGCLGFTEVDTGDNTAHWTGIHRMLAAFLMKLVQATTNEQLIETPFYTKFRDDEHPSTLNGQPFYKYFSQYSADANPDDPVLLDASEGKPNMVHMLATIASLLSVAERIPYATLNAAQIAKLSDATPVKPGSWRGSLADVLNGVDLQILTPTDKIMRLGLDPADL